jgi:hypothetical protein
MPADQGESVLFIGTRFSNLYTADQTVNKHWQEFWNRVSFVHSPSTSNRPRRCAAQYPCRLPVVGITGRRARVDAVLNSPMCCFFSPCPN